MDSSNFPEARSRLLARNNSRFAQHRPLLNERKSLFVTGTIDASVHGAVKFVLDCETAQRQSQLPFRAVIRKWLKGRKIRAFPMKGWCRKSFKPFTIRRKSQPSTLSKTKPCKARPYRTTLMCTGNSRRAE